MIYNFQISVILFLLGIGLYLNLSKERDASRLTRFLLGCGVFISILFFTFYGVTNYFTGAGITGAVVYYVNYGLSGAGFSEYIDLILISSLSLLLGAVFSLWIIFKRNIPKKSNKQFYFYIVLLLIFFSLFFNPVTAIAGEIVLPKTEKLDFDKNSEFYQFYKVPEMIEIDKPKNLVFIYAEGLERTYFNETIFPNLTENLREIESQSISFTNIRQEGYSHHTIGGMVASQCGFPLVSPAHGNTMGGMDHYLEYAICLGDLLHDAGYHLTYHGGSYLDFGGKGKFFSTHKFDEIYGVEQLSPKLTDKNYVSGWGLYDDSLFELTYNRFIELSKTKNKFAMFLLTLDTHHPDIMPSKSCNNLIYEDGKIPRLNAVACSDNLIAEFIKRIRQSEYSNNTVIVLVSDHLAMINDEIFKKADRTNLFIINEPGVHEGTKIDKWASTLDIGSTILPFIGYEGTIGLGRDIINRNESESQIKDIHQKLSEWEPYITQFWNFPKIEKSIEIETEQRKVYINNRPFKIPILIELTNELETSPKFEFDLTEEMESKSRISQTNEPFILIESCKKTSVLFNKTINYPGFCILAGKGSKYYEHMILSSHEEFTTKEIRKITGLN